MKNIGYFLLLVVNWYNTHKKMSKLFIEIIAFVILFFTLAIILSIIVITVQKITFSFKEKLVYKKCKKYTGNLLVSKNGISFLILKITPPISDFGYWNMLLLYDKKIYSFDFSTWYKLEKWLIYFKNNNIKPHWIYRDFYF